MFVYLIALPLVLVYEDISEVKLIITIVLTGYCLFGLEEIVKARSRMSYTQHCMF
eukprot:SAG31_NODE_13816_length_844_cov_1.492617_1_plen_55_part_00